MHHISTPTLYISDSGGAYPTLDWKMRNIHPTDAQPEILWFSWRNITSLQMLGVVVVQCCRRRRELHTQNSWILWRVGKQTTYNSHNKNNEFAPSQLLTIHLLFNFACSTLWRFSSVFHHFSFMEFHVTCFITCYFLLHSSFTVLDGDWIIWSMCAWLVFYVFSTGAAGWLAAIRRCHASASANKHCRDYEKSEKSKKREQRKIISSLENYV